MSSEIAEFYKNKSVFITGATGLLGKVLVEKLLRSCPDVKNIYLLIRNKKNQSVETRLEGVLSAKIFDKFNECSPNPVNKVIAIEGDITLPLLGLSQKDLSTLIREVSVVFHSAATVKFDEPLKIAVNYNVLGTQRVIQLCRQLSQLSAFIYVSTAYSNCNHFETQETVYPSPVSPQKIIDLCEWMSDEMLASITPELLGDYPNTYLFTKHLAESLLEDQCANMPLAIVRPSIVCSSWKEPLPGWVDTLTGMTGFILASGAGLARTVQGRAKMRLDIIPLDTVINLMLAVAWFTSTKCTGVHVFNCTSGQTNPITLGKIIKLLGRPNSTNYAWSNVYRYPNLFITSSEFVFKMSVIFNHLLPAHIVDGLMYLIGRKSTMVGYINKLYRAFSIIQFVTNNEFNFSNKNTMALYQFLSQTDKTIFDFDIGSLDWNSYFTDYWLGVRQYILKESNETLKSSRENLRKVYFRDMFVIITAIAFTGIFSSWTFTLVWRLFA